MDILKHYGFVVGAQNQIINLNGFILNASSSDSGPSPTAPPAEDTIFSNQNPNQTQNQSNSNHSALTQSMAAHLIQNTSASSTANDTDIRSGGGSGNSGGGAGNSGESIMVTRPDQILAIFPTSQQSQLNINSFNANANLIHHPDHLNVDNSSSSNCSFNRCNSSLKDNTRLPHSSCSNMQTFNSFIDSNTSSHLNRNARPINPSNCVSDV